MTMATLTLTDFLLARIGEDEERARAPKPDWDSEDYDEIDRLERLSNEQWHTHQCGWQVGEGMERQCICTVPARVVAECEFKRHLVAELERSRIYDDEGVTFGICVDMARLWADHPDYREEWRTLARSQEMAGIARERMAEGPHYGDPPGLVAEQEEFAPAMREMVARTLTDD